jgi:hypothetical protein
VVEVSWGDALEVGVPADRGRVLVLVPLVVGGSRVLAGDAAAGTAEAAVVPGRVRQLLEEQADAAVCVDDPPRAVTSEPQDRPGRVHRERREDRALPGHHGHSPTIWRT